MSSSAESRIITMQFQNSQFERGASQSLSTLQKLKAAMNFDNMKAGFSKASSGIGKLYSGASGLFGKLRGTANPFAPATQGLSDLQKQTNSFNATPITGGVSHISKSFIAMSAVAITAISNITNRVIDAGLQMAKSFTVAPIQAGLQEYETNLNSIQTILSNTKASGANLDDVNNALQQLNTYSDKTIYNFSEMARNIGTFTAAGVDLDTSVNSIKGIANLAALSGSNSQQASTAMYQLSQAISAGRVSLQDWNSVVNAGMGGTVFQRALAQTAVAMGEIDGKAVKLTGKMKNVSINGQSFRNSIMAKPGEQSWLTSKVLTNTLQQFTGDLSKAELKAQGFSDAQIKAIQAQAKMAQNAATKVKTLTQLIDVAKETAQSGWSKTWQYIFGDFKEARSSFTAASNTVNHFIKSWSKARNSLLKGWKEMGGRNLAIMAIRNAFQSLVKVVTAVHDGFREIFPATTSRELVAMTENFRLLMAHLSPSPKTLKEIQRIAAGVFAVFSIGVSIIKGFVGVVVDLFGAVGAGQGGFLKFGATIGDFLVALDQAIKKGGLLKGFFQGLTTILSIPLTILRSLAGLIGGLFDGFDSGGVGDAISGIGHRLSPVAAAVERVRGAFDGFGQFVANAVSQAITAIAGFGDAIANSFTSETFGSLLDTINTGLLAGLVLMLRNFFNGFELDVSGGLFASIKDTLGGVTEALSTMQTNLKANILLKIAAAIGIMAASLLVLSTIDPKKLTTALVGMAAMFVIMTTALTQMTTAMGVMGSLKLPALAAGIMGIATAMLILATAVKVMASMELGDMARGLVGIAAMLVILQKSMGPLTANAGGMIRVGAALILVALALKVMASAVQDFAALDLGDMARGMIGVAASMGILAKGMQAMPSNIFVTAAALVVLAVALKGIASAVSDFADLGWAVMVKGFVGIAGALGILAAAMRLMPSNMPVQAAALVVLGAALKVIGSAIASMGGMSVEQIAKGLITLAGALGILAAGLYLMEGGIGGAAALAISAAALALMVPVLIALGAMSWDMILKSLVMLAATFTILGIAGATVSPVIIALGAGMLLLGAGLALAGAGALAFASAFALVTAAGTAGAAVMSAILERIITAIPAALKAFGQGIVQFANAIGKGAPEFYRAFTAVINGLLNAALKAIPKIGKIFMSLLQTALNIVVKMTPQIVNAGFNLIIKFLAALSKNVPKIVNIASDIIVKFLNGISKNLPRIIDSGVKLIIKFIDGCSKAIDAHSGELGAAGGRLAVAIIQGMAKGIASGLSVIKDAAINVAKSALNAAKDFLGVNSPSKAFHDVGKWSSVGLAQGLETYSHVVDKSAENVAKGALNKLKATMSGVSGVVSSEIDARPTIRPVLDLSDIRKNANQLQSVFGDRKFSTAVSYKGASSVSSEMMEAARAAIASKTTTEIKEVKIEQNNYSPKPLDHVALYRQQRGLIPLVKEAVESDVRQ